MIPFEDCLLFKRHPRLTADVWVRVTDCKAVFAFWTPGYSFSHQVKCAILLPLANLFYHQQDLLWQRCHGSNRHLRKQTDTRDVSNWVLKLATNRLNSSKICIIFKERPSYHYWSAARYKLHKFSNIREPYDWRMLTTKRCKLTVRGAKSSKSSHAALESLHTCISRRAVNLSLVT